MTSGNLYILKTNRARATICGALTVCLSIALASDAHAATLANWRFEQVQAVDGSLSPAVAGQSLTGSDLVAVAPRPYSYDESGSKNPLQVWEPKDGSAPSGSTFSANVPNLTANGLPNTRSLALRNRDYLMLADKPLASADLRKSWKVEASVMTNRLDESQVFLCKERTSGTEGGDLTLAYDATSRHFTIEVRGGDGQLHLLESGITPTAGTWYDLVATATYNIATRKTVMTFSAKASAVATIGGASTATFDGTAMTKGKAMWIVGRGDAIKQFVTDGGIDEIRISGEGLPVLTGENPIIKNVFTADPAALVVGDTVYLYVGHDEAKGDQMFAMNDWLCYSSKDMKTWTPHGPIMKATDFKWAVGDAWAGQVVQKNGKFYFYTTVTHDNTKGGRAIGVAVSDSPTGPFVDARGSALITDDMTPSDKPWNDIDPTVFIDDDGTPWMAWGNPYLHMVKLKPNLTELGGPIQKIDLPNYTEGPWLHKRNGLYYLTYAAFAHQGMAEKICYATAKNINGPWTYQGILTDQAANSYTIHPAIIEFKKQSYLFYHNAILTLPNGETGAIGRRSVCVEYLYYNLDGTIKPVLQTAEGVSIPPVK